MYTTVETNGQASSRCDYQDPKTQAVASVYFVSLCPDAPRIQVFRPAVSSRHFTVINNTFPALSRPNMSPCPLTVPSKPTKNISIPTRQDPHSLFSHPLPSRCPSPQKLPYIPVNQRSPAVTYRPFQVKTTLHAVMYRPFPLT